MNLAELKQRVDFYFESANQYDDGAEKIKVMIPVFRVGSIGGQPCVDATNATLGFDWDNGRFFITAETTLREIDRDEIKSLLQKYDELSWKQYKISAIKRENENLKKKVQELQEKLDSSV